MNVQLSNGCRVEYAEAGHGLPMVLLHAFPLSRQMWQPQLEGLQDICRVIAPDLRGFGGTSGFESAPSIGQMADDVRLLLDALRIAEPAVIGGLSMGGYAALAFARDHAPRLRGLILADTRSEADTSEGKANREKMITFAERYTPLDVIDSMLSKMVSEETRSKRPELVESIRQIASAQTTNGIGQALRALRDRPDATNVLPSFQSPTLVIVGADDVLTPPSAAATLVSGIRGARLATIEGAGHLSNLECPEAFNEAVRTFLQSFDSSSPNS